MSQSNATPLGFDQDIEYSKLSALYGLVDGDQPDYMDDGMSMPANVSNSHNVAVVYITGSIFPNFLFLGLLLGGAYGVIKGFKSAPSSVFKIRVNSMLNNGAKCGTNLGNYLGIFSRHLALSVYPSVDVRSVQFRFAQVEARYLYQSS